MPNDETSPRGFTVTAIGTIRSPLADPSAAARSGSTTKPR
jgi:hypothetical protein